MTLVLGSPSAQWRESAKVATRLLRPVYYLDGAGDWNISTDPAQAARKRDTRATEASYFDRDGVLRWAVPYELRDQHFLNGLLQPPLVEVAATNLMPFFAPNKAQFNFATGSLVTDDPAYDGVAGFDHWVRVDRHATVVQNVLQVITPAPGPGVTYTVQCVIEMEDGGDPEIGTSTTGDFGVIIGGVGTGLTFTSMSRLGNTSRFLCSLAWPTGGAPNANFGIQKRPTHSVRPFRTTGFQVELAATGTTLIRTAGLAADRAADVLLDPILGVVYRDADGDVAIDTSIPVGGTPLKSAASAADDSTITIY